MTLSSEPLCNNPDCPKRGHPVEPIAVSKYATMWQCAHCGNRGIAKPDSRGEQPCPDCDGGISMLLNLYTDEVFGMCLACKSEFEVEWEEL